MHTNAWRGAARSQLLYDLSGRLYDLELAFDWGYQALGSLDLADPRCPAGVVPRVLMPVCARAGRGGWCPCLCVWVSVRACDVAVVSRVGCGGRTRDHT